jgi:ATP-binding cassette subfamily F protein uup
VEDGDRIGLLGVNGSGKSTLLRVLAGLEPADAGVIDRRRGARILYLPQEPELRPDASPRALVEEGLAEWHPPHVASKMLSRLGVHEQDGPVGTMSGGERRRVALARVLAAEPELAILDEPTNHLDTATIEWLEEHLAGLRGAVLLVTHDRYVLDAIATRVLELDGGKLREFQGGYADYLEQKETLLAHESRVVANRLNFVRRERAWLMRGARARTTKQKARIQRAEEAILAEPVREASRIQLDAAATRLGKTILELHDVGLERAGRRLIAKLTLYLVAGDRVGVVGLNGAGKTSLLQVVSGELAPTRGDVVRGTQTRVAYFDQARANLVDDWSVFDNVAEREGAERTGGGAVRLGDREVSLRVYLEQFLLDASKQRQKVRALSGGERARVALAKLLRTGANLLLLDEPTNDLDVDTLRALEEALLNFAGCAVVISHDRWFLDRIATHILAFEGDSQVVWFEGNYQDYEADRKRRLGADADQPHRIKYRKLTR